MFLTGTLEIFEKSQKAVIILSSDWMNLNSLEMISANRIQTYYKMPL